LWRQHPEAQSTHKGEMAMTGKTVLYWVITGVRLAPGYPLYMMTIPGTWKVLGRHVLAVGHTRSAAADARA
jgi:hypothetical protein